MANYSVASNKHATLAASAVDKVTLTGTDPDVEVSNHGSYDPIYFTHAEGADPPDPTVGGDNTKVVYPGESLGVKIGNTTSNTVVKLIAATITPYSVNGISLG